jgi:hypothetical protein
VGSSGSWPVGTDRLTCGCGADDCPAAQQGGSRTDVVIHVIAEQDSLTDDTPVQLDGAQPQPVDDKPVREITIGEALAPRQEPSAGPAHTTPAAAPATATREPGRGLAMPRRTRTRAENRNAPSKPNADSTTPTSPNATNHHPFDRGISEAGRKLPGWPSP